LGEHFLHGDFDCPRARKEFGEDFLGFLDVGRHVRRRHGFSFFAPEKKQLAQAAAAGDHEPDQNASWKAALPFAMEPVVYDFAINEKGTWADLLDGEELLLPQGYYALVIPKLLRQDPDALPPLRRAELDKFAAASRTEQELRGAVQEVFDSVLPQPKAADGRRARGLSGLLEQKRFLTGAQHEQIRTDLKEGRIGLAQKPAARQHENRGCSTGRCHRRDR